MNTPDIQWPVKRKRNRYSEDFKRQMVAACCAPGVSVASIALANGINANLLRRWVSQCQPNPVASAALQPGPTDVIDSPAFIRLAPQAPCKDPGIPLEVKLQRGEFHLSIAGTSAACAEFVRVLLG
jgi:transposase